MLVFLEGNKFCLESRNNNKLSHVKSQWQSELLEWLSGITAPLGKKTVTAHIAYSFKKPKKASFREENHMYTNIDNK